MRGPIELQDAFKGYTLDQDKILAPEQTVERFRARLKEVDLDILKGTMRIDHGRLDIPVYFSLCGRDAELVIGTKKQMGKGGTPRQSEASAVMELAERFSFFSFCKDPGNFIIEEYRNLKDPVLPFESIARSVHDTSGELDAAREIFSRLPLKWTWAYNLTQGQELLIPFDWFFAINEFNGPCAGNCKEEALLQGICEVVERHVSSIISRSRMRTPAILRDSITDPVARELIDKFDRAGVRLFMTDFSLDTGIPSVGVLAYDPSTFPVRSEIVWTAGTTPCPHKALIRALTEVAQLAGDFNTSSNYVASGLPKFKDLEEALFITQPDGAVPLGQLPDLSHANMKVEVESCIAALSGKGREVVAVDVTHPGLRIPAFYTVIPGAHFRERAAGTSVGMFCAKLISQNPDPLWALAKLEEMDRLMPEKYYVRFYLGTCHLSLQRPQRAMGFLEEALTLGPKDEDIPIIYVYMGVCLKELERYREALAVLEKAERYDAERTDVHNLMGFCCFKLKEHERAIEHFRQVLRLNPASAIDYANIASNYREMGEYGKAADYYRTALELDPGIEFARENLDRLSHLAGKQG
ncbi:MAG: YcaO-like family protein [Thermodesulfobacteriota bacterium]